MSNVGIRKAAWVVKDASLGARQVRIVISDATTDRVGDIMVPEGCDWADYRSNPIVLAQHDPDSPIGTASLKMRHSRIEALIDFAPAGISKKADEYCGLAKAGIINAASVGFDPVEKEPLRGGGWRYTKWKLLEISLVSVPANPAATTIERSMPAQQRHRGNGMHQMSEQSRAEYRLRQICRVDGIVELTDGEMDAYLALLFPALMAPKPVPLT